MWAESMVGNAEGQEEQREREEEEHSIYGGTKLLRGRVQGVAGLAGEGF